VKTLSRVDESRTRGFTKRARKRRAGIPDLDAFVTFPVRAYLGIWQFVVTRLDREKALRRNGNEAQICARRRNEGMGLGLRLIHAQQNEMQNQTDFQENPSKVL
jgi:hypothetical protein